jgi:hypothetical protein
VVARWGGVFLHTGDRALLPAALSKGWGYYCGRRHS